MKPSIEELATAPAGRLRKWCCSKCGGVLAQVYDQATGKYVVICGTNRCQPLSIQSFSFRRIRETQSEMDAMEVANNYPDLAPKADPGTVENLKLYPD